MLDRIYKCPICGKPTEYCPSEHSLCRECGWQMEGCDWPKEKPGKLKKGEVIIPMLDEIPEDTLRRILKQANISEEEFLRLINEEDEE